MQGLRASPSALEPPSSRADVPSREAAARLEALGSAPAHWVRDVQALQGGPPADWMERVRRGSPLVPTSLTQLMAARLTAIAPRPAEPSVSNPPEARVGEAPFLPAPPPAPPRSSEMAPREPSFPVGTSPDQETREPSRLIRWLGVLGASRLEHPEPRAGSESFSPIPRVEVSARAQPVRVVMFAPRRAPARAPSEPSVARPGEEPVPSTQAQTLPIVAYPWGEEPVVSRKVDAEPPQHDLSALIASSWPSLADESTPEANSPPRFSAEAPEARRSAPWPDLPEPPTDSAEEMALLQQWERLSRLDREQRGE